MKPISEYLGGGTVMREQIITEDGIWSRPPGMAGNIVYVTLIGGGASGGYNSSNGTAEGGWGGQYLIDFPVDIGDLQSVACTIGLGGVPTSSPATSIPGGTTSFGSLLSVLGASNQLLRGGAPGGGPATAGTSALDGKDSLLGLGGKLIGTGNQKSPGGGGIILDAVQVQAPSAPGVSGAQGYGAGGWSYGISVGSRQSGVNGAIRVRWPEYI